MKGGYYKDLQISVVFICNRGYGSEHVTVKFAVYVYGWNGNTIPQVLTPPYRWLDFPLKVTANPTPVHRVLDQKIL